MTHTNFSGVGLNGSEMLAAAGPSCRPARFVNNPPADRRMRPVFPRGIALRGPARRAKDRADCAVRCVDAGRILHYLNPHPHEYHAESRRLV